MDIKEINKRTIEQFRAGGPIDGMHRERLVLLDDNRSQIRSAAHDPNDVRPRRWAVTGHRLEHGRAERPRLVRQFMRQSAGDGRNRRRTLYGSRQPADRR